MDFVFLIVGVEDVEDITVRNLDDLAGEGIGRGQYGEKYEKEKRNDTDCHSLIPGIVDSKTSHITFYSITHAFSLRSLRGCAVMVTSYDG